MRPFDETIKLANGVPMWVFCILVVGMVFLQTIVFVMISRRYSKAAGVTPMDTRRSIRAGFISTLGPALSVFVVGLGLITQIGAPLTLSRLSVIGNATYEASSAEMAAVAMGTSIGAETYSVKAFTASVWVMNLGGICMILPAMLFLKPLSKLTQEADKKLVGGMVLGLSASLASFGYFSVDYAKKNTFNLIAVLVAFFAMLGLEWLAKRKKVGWLREWAMAISILLSMAVVMIVRYTGGNLDG